MHYNTLVVNVDELWLKGKNRPTYFKALTNHIKTVVKYYHADKFYCYKEAQRLLVKSDSHFLDDVINALLKVPGIHSINPAKSSDSDLEMISEVAIEEMSSLIAKNQKSLLTFKVRSKRANKTFCMNSMELSREIGHRLLCKFGEKIKVDVISPDVFIDIKILDRSTFISGQKLLGIGGLPVGTSGHLLTMLSGGFDSPVSSYLMSKRGCKQSFIFFYAYPYVSDEVKEKILQLSQVLGRYQNGMNLYIFPFGEIQKIIAKNCRPEYKTILFRKYMLDCANFLADQIAADAILTGDALGQVSSQTIGNISMMDLLSKRPILRPLIGLNKVEIINLAKTICTHDISVLPHDDACSMFAPKHPIIKPNVEYVKSVCTDLDSSIEIAEYFKQATVVEILPTGEIKSLR
ncbi:MAG: tRNA 4-thiouridine(8) synthase ThiI [Bacteriovoracaceae bacterium]|nr:tRNA 4-thiouridine(8) synthase ThiI [Bacteriovoracaceae bacterium]